MKQREDNCKTARNQMPILIMIVIYMQAVKQVVEEMINILNTRTCAQCVPKLDHQVMAKTSSNLNHFS